MNNIKSYFFFLLLSSLGLCAQQKATGFIINPYLQDAEPDSIKILWESNSKDKSWVEWGKTSNLGEISYGKTEEINYGPSHIHEVKLTGLEHFTEYYYKVHSGELTSKISQFRTPPSARQTKSFNLVAMSDMQIDREHKYKFSELVNKGVINYFDEEFEGELHHNLALLMLPGDLVENGAEYHQWKHHFFDPAQELLSKVPAYPVLGNHERNSQFYFNYFSLPKNGTPAYDGHWWYKDYGNVRIIGLDSNDGYADSKNQFDWLKNVLDKTEHNQDIDFVFVQLHHPHKSELWIPGERQSSGKVVKMLESFSTKTGKPSVHLFGHTHGYSRGQSKEHNHLWVNVASAGGAIDNWGEFEGRDYDEFTVTQDEYGFVIITVDTDEKNPKFTLKRVSRGNIKNGIKDNEITDTITVFRLPKKPKAPLTVAPKNSIMPTRNVVLKAGEFVGGRSEAFHAASQWQVSKTNDFETLVFDSWKQHQNWYYEEDRQKHDDLTDEKIKPLEAGTTYYWRVRYRDQYLNWSDWSRITKFKTKN